MHFDSNNGSVFIKFVLFICFVHILIETKAKELKIIEIYPKNEDQNEFISDLFDKFEIRFVTTPTSELLPVISFINETEKKPFLEILRSHKIAFRLLDAKPVFDLIDEEKRGVEVRVEAYDYFSSYSTLNQMYTELDRINKTLPKNAFYYKFGTTYENRSLNAIKLFDDSPKGKVVVIECGAHPREWISPAFCMWTVNKLLANHDLLKYYDFLLIPVFNPDGYEYTWIKDTPEMEEVDYSPRFWRKNREFNEPQWNYHQNRTKPIPIDNECIGTDLNRNFQTPQVCVNTSRGCREDYCGGKAFNTRETIALRDELTKIKDQIVAYFSIHSFGQLWLHPHSYTLEKAPDNELLIQWSRIAVKAIYGVHNEKYKFGTSGQLLYLAGGISFDWVYDELKVKPSFAIELRPINMGGPWAKYSFMLTKDQIKPTCEEAFAGIQAVLQELPPMKATPKPTEATTPVVLNIKACEYNMIDVRTAFVAGDYLVLRGLVRKDSVGTHTRTIRVFHTVKRNTRNPESDRYYETEGWQQLDELLDNENANTLHVFRTDNMKDIFGPKDNSTQKSSQIHYFVFRPNSSPKDWNTTYINAFEFDYYKPEDHSEPTFNIANKKTVFRAVSPTKDETQYFNLKLLLYRFPDEMEILGILVLNYWAEDGTSRFYAIVYTTETADKNKKKYFARHYLKSEHQEYKTSDEIYSRLIWDFDSSNQGCSFANDQISAVTHLYTDHNVDHITGDHSNVFHIIEFYGEQHKNIRVIIQNETITFLDDEQPKDKNSIFFDCEKHPISELIPLSDCKDDPAFQNTSDESDELPAMETKESYNTFWLYLAIFATIIAILALIAYEVFIAVSPQKENPK